MFVHLNISMLLYLQVIIGPKNHSDIICFERELPSILRDRILQNSKNSHYSLVSFFCFWIVSNKIFVWKSPTTCILTSFKVNLYKNLHFILVIRWQTFFPSSRKKVYMGKECLKQTFALTQTILGLINVQNKTLFQEQP